MPKKVKATFVLPSDLLDELRVYVQAGLADSLSGLVRESLELRAKQLREHRLEQEFRAAAKDPMFLSDLADSMDAFDAVPWERMDE